MEARRIERAKSTSDQVLLDLWSGGRTMTQIAEVVGLSRERVRQRLKEHGLSGRNPRRGPTEEQIRDRLFTCASTRELAREIGVSEPLLLRRISDLGIEEEAERAFEAEASRRAVLRKAREGDELLQRVRKLAAEVGHTPTEEELSDAGIFHAQLANAFGTAAEAMRTAGLRPNVRGRPPVNLPDGFAGA
jgi:hypothetical protein